MPTASTRKTPGRRSTIATHPQRDAIEADCAAGTPLRRVAERHGVGAMSLWRHWRSLSPEHRAELASAVQHAENQRWREVSAGLAAIAQRHPKARADLAALQQRLSMPLRSSCTQEHAHAA